MDPDKHHQLFRKGLDAFNSGRFYDAHEDWEEVWLHTLNPEKMFLQGLIQVAAAFHHYSKQNRAGTRNLLRAGIAKLEHFPDVHRGLKLEPLRQSVRHWIKEFDAGLDPSSKQIPHIIRIERPHGTA